MLHFADMFFNLLCLSFPLHGTPKLIPKCLNKLSRNDILSTVVLNKLWRYEAHHYVQYDTMVLCAIKDYISDFGNADI